MNAYLTRQGSISVIKVTNLTSTFLVSLLSSQIYIVSSRNTFKGFTTLLTHNIIHTPVFAHVNVNYIGTHSPNDSP
jgi:hypothetical protein